MLKKILFIVLFAFVVLGCRAISNIESKEPTIIQPGLEKQPEPSEPRLIISVSGVSEDTLVTVRIHTFKGHQAQWGTFTGKDTGEFIITHASSSDYIVTAEVEGHTSEPSSYKIRLNGEIISLVENRTIISRGISELHFVFTLMDK